MNLVEIERKLASEREVFSQDQEEKGALKEDN